MKHSIYPKLILLFICFFTSHQVDAQLQFTIGGIKYMDRQTTPESVSVIPNSYSGDIIIPETVTYSGTQYNVTEIRLQAFLYTGVTSVSIPKTVTYIGNKAFSGCSGLTSIRIFNSEPPSLGVDLFYNVNLGSCKIYVPNGSFAKYTAASGWSDFSNIIEFDAVSVEQTASNSVKLYNEAGFVVVKGVDYVENIRVYTADGIAVKTIRVQNQNEIVRFRLPANQIYMIQIGKTAYKVVTGK